MKIAATVSAFLTHVRVEKGLSSNTVSAYRRDLVKFDEFARKRKLSLEAVSRDDLVDFLAGLYRQKLESKTVARHLVTLRNFFRFAQIQDLISEDPRQSARQPNLVRESAGRAAQPCRRVEDTFILRTPSGYARSAYPAHAAAQLCHALARARSGSPVRAAHARPRGHLHHPNLHPRGRGAVEADLQSASPACITRQARETHCGCLCGSQRGHPEAEGAQCQTTCFCWKAGSLPNSAP